MTAPTSTKQRSLFDISSRCTLWKKGRLFCTRNVWNGEVPVSSRKLREREFYSLSSCSFTFTWFLFVTSWTQFYVWFFLAPRLAQRPRQPPSSLNGSTDPGRYQTGRLQKLDFPLPNVVPTAVKAGKRQFRAS